MTLTFYSVGPEFSKCRAGRASNLKYTFQARLSTTALIPFLRNLPRDWENKYTDTLHDIMLRDCVRPPRFPRSKNLENHEKTLTSCSCCGKYIKTFKWQGNKLKANAILGN